jgi:hypothetical protein
VRNYSASLGLAVLGTIQVSVFRSHLATSLVGQGVPRAEADKTAATIAQAGQGSGTGKAADIPHFVSLDFAYATRTVFYAMAVIMAVAAVVAFVGLQQGVQEDLTADSEVAA